MLKNKNKHTHTNNTMSELKSGLGTLGDILHPNSTKEKMKTGYGRSGEAHSYVSLDEIPCLEDPNGCTES